MGWNVEGGSALIRGGVQMNVVVLIGRMVADPELRYTPSGLAVTSFRIAVDRRFKKEGEQTADFIDVVAWKQSAEFAANYLTKGRLVGVEGRLQQRSWVQQDGQKRSKIEVVANSLQGLDKPRDTQAGGPPAAMEPESAVPAGVEEGPEADMDYDPFAEE
jgi:single-strand DNA-binding protein